MEIILKVNKMHRQKTYVKIPENQYKLADNRISLLQLSNLNCHERYPPSFLLCIVVKKIS